MDLQFICHLFLLSARLLLISGAVITSSSDGTFNITGNGVGGEGTYSITNGTTEVGLHLVIASMEEKQEVTHVADKNAVNAMSMASQKDDSTETEITFTNEDEEFLDEMLAEHNKLRSVHLAPPLVKNINMSLQAKVLATQLAAEASLRHSDKRTRPDQGENLAMGCISSGPGISAKDAAKEWYDEVCSHNFFNQAYQDKSGHFSQLVWKATRELGVGKATGTKFGMNCTFIVARYRPLGNIGSEFASDISKGHFDSSYCTNVQRDQLPRVGEDKPTVVSRNFRYRTKIPRTPKIVIL